MGLLERITGKSQVVENIDVSHKERILKRGHVTVSFDFPGLMEIQSRIFPATLHEGLRPLFENAHVTLKYGIKGSVSEKRISDCLEGVPFSVCMASNMSIYQARKYDILKFDVDGKTIKDAQKAIWGFGRTGFLPIYNGMLRVAKLKTGAGKMIVGLYDREEYMITPKYAVYYDVYGDIHLVKSW